MTQQHYTTQLERPKAILVGVDFGLPHFDAELTELALLAQTAGYDTVATLCCKRRAPDARLFIGSGKADELQALATLHGATEVLFDQALSPAQQRNLERQLGLPVNDRTLLILEIFAQRARSHEGKLQVELARLQYLSTRLVRRWSHLERQAGGVGLRGGPGEKQIELDKRMIGTAIKRTKAQLASVMKQRQTQRRSRQRSGHYSVALVGYTNAGKSSLFNALVKAEAYAADQLFATLDTTTRSLYLQELGSSINLSDTVGFIRDLPHGLVNAFAATLQEAAEADLLLHVVDAAHPEATEQIDNVLQVLSEIGAQSIAQILVFNKLDALPAQQQPLQLSDHYELHWPDGRSVIAPRVFLSATAGLHLDQLRLAIARAQQESAQAQDYVPDEDDPRFL